MSIPVTVFTGYLGSGKTTIILNIIKQLPPTYNSIWLKNEFGNMAIDTELAKENNIKVTEILNGCLCCVLVGKLENALNEIVEKYAPDRIFVETSGSAYPAPIAWEVRKNNKLKLDGIVTVIDALNFKGYKDKGYTAKLQAKYTDLILINKHELVDEKTLEENLDDVYELNHTTPKVKTDKGYISKDLVLGLDSKLFENYSQVEEEEQGKEEHHHDLEVEIMELESDKVFIMKKWEEVLSRLTAWDFYRIKGIVNLGNKFYLLNSVFGRYEFTELTKYSGKTKVTFMGKNLDNYIDEINKTLELTPGDLSRTNLTTE